MPAIVDVNGGLYLPSTTGRPVQPPRRRGAHAAPEPRGTGLRVTMQRLSVTAKGVLDRPFMFQVPPLEEFSVPYEWGFTDYDTIGVGMRTRPGSKQLSVISFDSLFVDDDYAFVVNKRRPYNPVALVQEIKEIGDARTPFQLLVGQPALWGVYYDVNMAVTLRSFRSSERSGERDARYYSISFTEFRGISSSELAQGLQANAPRAGGQSTIAVLDIDDLPANMVTLQEIAKHYYGTVSLWPVIAKASGISVAGTVNLKTHFANYIPKPKIIVPAAERKG